MPCLQHFVACFSITVFPIAVLPCCCPSRSHQCHPGVLDGDLLEQLLELPQAARREVLQRVPAEALRAAQAAARSGRDDDYYEAVAAVDVRLQAQEEQDGKVIQVEEADATAGVAVGAGQSRRVKLLREGDLVERRPLGLWMGRAENVGGRAEEADELESVLQVLQDVLTL